MSMQPTAAQAAVDTYAALVGGERTEPLETQIVDLLTDLLHLARQNGSEPEALCTTAQLHYEAEQAEAAD